MQPLLPIRPCCFHYSLPGGVNVWLDPFRVLNDRVLFRIFRGRVLFRALSDRALYRPSVIGSSLGYSVIGFLFCVLFKILSNGVLFKVILRVLSEASHLMFSFSGMSCVIRCINNFRALHRFSVLNISIGKEIQLSEIWVSSWKNKKGSNLDFWLGSDFTYAESSIFRSIHPKLFEMIVVLKGFPRVSRKFFLRECFSKKL